MVAWAPAPASELPHAVLAAFLHGPYPAGPRRRPPPPLRRHLHRRLLRVVVPRRRRRLGRSLRIRRPVKLLYAKYLGALDRWIQSLPEAQPPPSSEKQRHELLICDADGGGREEPPMHCNGRGQQHQHVVLKRKREDVAGMLDWVRELAGSVSEEGTAAAGLADGYFSVALAAPEAVARKRARRSCALAATGCFIWSNHAFFPLEQDLAKSRCFFAGWLTIAYRCFKILEGALSLILGLMKMEVIHCSNVNLQNLAAESL